MEVISNEIMTSTKLIKTKTENWIPFNLNIDFTNLPKYCSYPFSISLRDGTDFEAEFIFDNDVHPSKSVGFSLEVRKGGMKNNKFFLDFTLTLNDIWLTIVLSWIIR